MYGERFHGPEQVVESRALLKASALRSSAQSNVARGGYSQYLVVEPPELAGGCLIVNCFKRSLCFDLPCRSFAQIQWE
jgi:hypothetical protein